MAIRYVSPAALALFVALVSFSPPGEVRASAKAFGAGGDPRPRGQAHTFKLASAPFPHRDRATGYELDGVLYSSAPHYADSSVTVFVPPGWEPSGRVDLVFFFHGWMSSREAVVSDFDLFGQFEASGKLALLVIPETAYEAPDSFGGKFEERGGFERFVLDLAVELDARSIVPRARPGNIVLAAHSGGYRILASILRRGGLAPKIREVWLFDALYARKEAFADWIAAQSSLAGLSRFICVTSENEDTSGMAEGLEGLLRQRGIALVSMGEDQGLDAARLRSRVLFIRSDADHFGLVHEKGEFRVFLSSSKALRGGSAGALSASGPTFRSLVADAPSWDRATGRQ